MSLTLDIEPYSYELNLRASTGAPSMHIRSFILMCYIPSTKLYYKCFLHFYDSGVYSNNDLCSLNLVKLIQSIPTQAFLLILYCLLFYYLYYISMAPTSALINMSSHCFLVRRPPGISLLVFLARVNLQSSRETIMAPPPPPTLAGLQRRIASQGH